MAQVGLCAFRHGFIKDSHNALHELCASGKIKELMAQGFQMLKYGEKPPESEKQRQIPFHMHINLELLECVYLTTSMLLEIPNLAASYHDQRKKIISKYYRRLYDFSERNVFIGMSIFMKSRPTRKHSRLHHGSVKSTCKRRLGNN